MSSRENIESFVKLEGAMLSQDDTARNLVCPFCHGGQSGEATFSITRAEYGLVYNCYRSTCDKGRGFVPMNGVLLQPRPVARQDDGLRPYTGAYRPIDDRDRTYFDSRFGLSVIPEFSIGVNERDEYVFEVRDPLSRVRGYVVRTKPWLWAGENDPSVVRYSNGWSKDSSKSKLLMHQQGPTQSWYFPTFMSRCAPEIVIVEDQISAMKVAQAGFVSVANLGTFIDERKVREIAVQRPRLVVIAFDNDASSTALKMARKWGLAFPAIRVALLERDIKDTDPNDVREALSL